MSQRVNEAVTLFRVLMTAVSQTACAEMYPGRARSSLDPEFLCYICGTQLAVISVRFHILLYFFFLFEERQTLFG
jgi:hypothetical protein